MPPTEATRWDDLRVFLAVLRAGSFSAAAEQLGVEQSTISRRISHLESELGQLLFDRQPAGPQPTALAQRMRDHVERAATELLAITDLAASYGEAIEGRVRLALTESFAVHVFLPNLFSELRSKYPALHVDLIASTTAADLGRREADLAIRAFRPTQGDLITTRVARLPAAVLAHRSYLETRTDPSELAWIALDLALGSSADAAQVTGHGPLAPVMVTNSYIVQVEAVRAGHGVAWLARAHLAMHPELTIVDMGFPTAPPIEIWLAAPRTVKAIPRVSALWDFLAERLHALETV